MEIQPPLTGCCEDLKTEREKTVYPTVTQALQEVQQENPMRRVHAH